MRVGGGVQFDRHHRESGNGRNGSGGVGSDGDRMVVGREIESEVVGARGRTGRRRGEKHGLRDVLRRLLLMRLLMMMLRGRLQLRRRVQASQRHRGWRMRVRTRQRNGNGMRQTRLLLSSG